MKTYRLYINGHYKGITKGDNPELILKNIIKGQYHYYPNTLEAVQLKTFDSYQLEEENDFIRPMGVEEAKD